MNRSLLRVIILAVFFSIAMGFLEASVVVYLRQIYYPEGFGFPLAPIDNLIGLTELLREAATIIMLITFGAIAGHDGIRRFGFFLFSFGIWDIIYYIVLKWLLNWPASIMDWDILFLIPIPWFAPVLAPCIVSTLMIIFAILLFRAPAVSINQLIKPVSWIFLCAGSLVIIGSFIIDYLYYAIPIAGNTTGNQQLLAELSQFIPGNYRWWIFISGIIIISCGIINIQKQQLRIK